MARCRGARHVPAPALRNDDLCTCASGAVLAWRWVPAPGASRAKRPVISRRFLPLVCALIAMALVPTLIHSYFESTIEDGLTTATIPLSLAGYDGRPSGRDPSWGERRFESGDWIE